MHGKIPYLFDCLADPVAHLLLLKSSMATDIVLSFGIDMSSVLRSPSVNKVKTFSIFLCPNNGLKFYKRRLQISTLGRWYRGCNSNSTSLPHCKCRAYLFLLYLLAKLINNNDKSKEILVIFPLSKNTIFQKGLFVEFLNAIFKALFIQAPYSSCQDDLNDTSLLLKKVFNLV